VIECVGVTKKFGETTAVDRVSFRVEDGECFGILGPNGAGKTSTFRMMYGSSIATSGDMFINGLNARTHIRKIKSLLGVVPQEDGLDPDFTVIDNLLVFGSYYRLGKARILDRSKQLLRSMHLEDYADRPIAELSGGMKRRLTIARALLTEPKILLLDEPTTGLDPQARLWIWNELKELKKRGVTIVLTTHYMEEAETLCDRIVIMNKGAIVAGGTPKALIGEHVGQEVVEFEVEHKDLPYYLDRVKDRFPYQLLKNRIHFHLKRRDEAEGLIKEINSEQIVIRKATLNDVFLKIAGYEISD
jgi:lipooligosaccharide transport system ATP-binding protein